MAPPFQGWLLFRLLSWRKLLCQSQMRIIFKCPHIKGGTGKASAHLENYVSYVATREGVQKVPENKTNLPATKKQRQIIAQLIRDFPLSKGLFEYDDFQSAPTQGNASEFIARALEDNLDQVAKKENYLEYIAQRPRAQKVGAHGLFSNSDEPIVLSQIADAVAHHPGTVWLPIISLRREDAARLGYDNAEQWKTLLTSYTADMARAMKIPVEDFRWYAAVHDVIREEARREFLLQSVTRLLHHMSRIFQEQAPAPGKGIRFTDKKLRQKIREKKMAQGHKADDHEPEMSM